MKVDSELLSQLKEAVAIKFGHTPRTPSDFDALSLDIQIRTGRTIGISTLKRLWGYVRAQSGTTYSTLSLISRYVGYNDWDAFCLARVESAEADDSGFSPDYIVKCSSLPVGQTILLRWGKNKALVIRKTQHPERFEIIHAENIKLKPGDTADITTLALGNPFCAGYCMRGKRILGAYTGARRDGISSIEIIEPE